MANIPIEELGDGRFRVKMSVARWVTFLFIL